MFLDLDDFK